MKLSVGIVGLPNVGKSTLFNALLKKQVALAANYPFATIEPNVGVIEVPDERLARLAEVVHTNTLVPAAIEFYDIAGLVKGASEGEGLGNQFLSHIRETALIAHVVRIFDDANVIHVDDKHDPIQDIQTIDTELILSDLNILTKQKEPRGSATKEEKLSWETGQLLIEKMNQGLPARKAELNEDQIESIRQFNLLTMKPVLYICNVSENQLMDMEDTKKRVTDVLVKIGETSAAYIIICAKLESDVIELDSAEQKEYLQQYGLEDTGLNRLIKTAYEHLGLISFLTAGEKEARAWTITKGTKAPQAAGVIHTDFEKHFIKADIVPYQDFVDFGGWTKAREAGKVTLAGKDYEMKDGDVVEFKVGV